MIDGYQTATRSPRRHKTAAWVVLSALLLNLAAGFVLPSTAQAALAMAGVSDNLSSDSLSSGVQVICTPNGLRVVRFGPDGGPLPDQRQQGANCVYCLPLNMGQTAMAGAQALELAPPFSAERITYPVSSLASSSGGLFDRRPIRAPPLFQ